MTLAEINPYLRYAELQPSVMSQPPHALSYDYRLFYVLSGPVNLVLEDRAILLHTGSAVYLRPATPYYFDKKVKIMVLNFDMSRDNASKKKALRPSVADSFDSSKIFENDPPDELSETLVAHNAYSLEPLFEECVAGMGASEELADAHTSATVKRILCYMLGETMGAADGAGALAGRVMLYIKKNYDKDITNKKIASALGYHSYYLNSVFKQNTGMTIHQRLISERISVAKKLLANTNLSVEEISLEVGFFDRGQLCTVFKKKTGKTPLEYRRARKK
ncbi:MAG: AraC family transcriptional regulator [Clostridia bacterium]|nr:AraC family transcriptional regulator [Clostridia bacterium]